jgi:hypothetical protein
MTRCVDPSCNGVYTAVPDGVTVWHGMHLHTEDRSEMRCTVCLRTVEECYEEEA